MRLLNKYQIQFYLQNKRGNPPHIFLQFTTEKLNDYKMFDNIFVLSDLRQPETLSVCNVPHPVSTTRHFSWIIESHFLKDIPVEQKS